MRLRTGPPVSTYPVIKMKLNERFGNLDVPLEPGKHRIPARGHLFMNNIEFTDQDVAAIQDSPHPNPLLMLSRQANCPWRVDSVR